MSVLSIVEVTKKQAIAIAHDPGNPAAFTAVHSDALKARLAVAIWSSVAHILGVSSQPQV
jgi:hypothetical protein